MFAATTSEDFAAVATTTSASASSIIRILLLNNSNNDDYYASIPEQLQPENAHLYGSLGWFLSSLPNKSSESSLNEETDLSVPIKEQIQSSLKYSQKRFEDITGKKSKINLDPNHDEKEKNTDDAINLSTQAATKIEIVTDDDDSKRDKSLLIESDYVTSLNKNDSSSCVTLLMYLNTRRQFFPTSSTTVAAVSSSSDDEKNTSHQENSFLKLVLPSLTPSHGMSSLYDDDERCCAKFEAVAYCLLQPKMHRRIPLIGLSISSKDEEGNNSNSAAAVAKTTPMRMIFRSAVTLDQLMMEVMQKGGVLGKYGA